MLLNVDIDTDANAIDIDVWEVKDILIDNEGVTFIIIDMNKYKVEPNIFATNLWAVYCNGEIIYSNIYKSECERKLQEFIKEDTVEEVLEELDD